MDVDDDGSGSGVPSSSVATPPSTNDEADYGLFEIEDEIIEDVEDDDVLAPPPTTILQDSGQDCVSPARNLSTSRRELPNPNLVAIPNNDSLNDNDGGDGEQEHDQLQQQQQQQQQFDAAKSLLYHRTNSSSNLLLMKRVGSCFFSVSGSVGSDLDLLDWTATSSSTPSDQQNHRGSALVTSASFVSADEGAGEDEVGEEGEDENELDEKDNNVGRSTERELADAVAAASAATRKRGTAKTGTGPSAPSSPAATATVCSPSAVSSPSPSSSPTKTDVAQVKWNAVDVLYHDVMMNVFSFMPAADLASFSTTGLRPNYDVFYYLQLQLERALLLDPTTTKTTAVSCRRRSVSSHSTCPIKICGAGILSRLAKIDRNRAERLVSTYRAGGGGGTMDNNAHHNQALIALQHKISNASMKEKGAASCAVVFTVLGATHKMMETVSQNCTPAQQAALLGCTAGLGLVAGRRAYENSAAGRVTDGDDGSHGDGGGASGGGGGGGAGSAAWSVARKMQNLLMTLPHPNGTGGEEGMAGSVFPRHIVEGLRQFHGGGGGGGGEQRGKDDDDGEKRRRRNRRGKRSKRKGSGDSADMVEENDKGEEKKEENEGEDEEEKAAEEERGPGSSSSSSGSPSRCIGPVAPFSADPYEHLDEDEVEAVNDEDEGKNDDSVTAYEVDGEEKLSSSYGSSVASSNSTHQGRSRRNRPAAAAAVPGSRRKRPTGCVGAYARVLRLATEAVTDHVKSQRRAAYDDLTDDAKVQLTTAFIDACSSDATLPIVKDLVRKSGIDVNGFYVGSDGSTETCPLHTAAFNGAAEVLKFLCSGIDETDPNGDGGLADVDRVDDNGWTALHFAAGADAVPVIRTLASFGASLTVEAGNGYTPYHWAERLSNTAAAEELKRLGADERFLEFKMMFGAQRQPLTFLANRFFALIPTAIPTNG